MTKRVFIIHGWEGSPQEPMHQWLKKELESKGFSVIIPKMPNADAPIIKEWIDKLQEVATNLDKETFFIGHSVGCQGILRYLETLSSDVKIGGAIFIAPWLELDQKTIEEEGEEVIEIADPWVKTPINWDKVKSHCDKFTCILSDNDYYVPLSNKQLFEQKLNAKIIIEENKGHFAPADNISDNPTALKELIQISG